MRVAFTVPGIPRPKGSTRAFRHRHSGKIITRSDNAERLEPWEAAIGWQAKAAGLRPHPEACSIRLVFAMPRPKGHYGARGLRPSAPSTHTKKPDLDKLIRAVLDALTGIAWVDDSQLVEVIAAKRYVDADETPGVEIVVTQEEEGKP